ncbi:hypothetical protein [Photobacterium leiognathi]|uniref:hypothetical protein n=1 Tax=Photobacterium leiognathi TaxID=553611 RepID=UPI000208866E|nr:hypothetical protein [Photobacterium leiognathi]GAA06457.1 putative uncharacterized domain protein [Photobacterium leiognathi subsp. mandapamensis svers.1.1.]
MAKHQCPNCHSPISLSYLLFSKYTTQYRCVKCSALMASNRRRKITGLTLAFLSATLYSLINSHIQNPLLTASLMFIVFFSILWLVPNQVELVDENVDS